MDRMQSINLIAINPDVRSGRPYIVGTTITVADVIQYSLQASISTSKRLGFQSENSTGSVFICSKGTE